MKAQVVKIYNEAGTAVIAEGLTTNDGTTVTSLSAPVVESNEYQLQVAGGKRVGRMCTEYDAANVTAKFE